MRASGLFLLLPLHASASAVAEADPTRSHAKRSNPPDPYGHAGGNPIRTLRLVLTLALAALTLPFAASGAADIHADASCGRLLRSTEPSGLPGLDFERDHDFAFESCMGKIRPGAAMTAPAGCTFSFILRDAAGNLYTGTAAHCVRLGDRVSTHTIGAFGTVITDGALGVDYALVRIDANKYDKVDPTMCAWGGPIGADPGDRPVGDVLLEYGWGFATSSTAFTRTRELVETTRSPGWVAWTGVGSGGDSGGPIVSVEGYAVASHTTGLTPLAGVTLEAGPSFAAMLASGRTAVPTLQLVTGDPTNVERLAQTLRG